MAAGLMAAIEWAEHVHQDFALVGDLSKVSNVLSKVLITHAKEKTGII